MRSATRGALFRGGYDARMRCTVLLVTLATTLALPALGGAQEQPGADEEIEQGVEGEIEDGSEPWNLVLQRAELEPVRAPERIESFAVEDLLDLPDRPAPNPRATPVPTNVPGRFTLLPGPLPVPGGVATELTRLLGDRASYATGRAGCYFSPGVALRFHHGANAVDAFVCFLCRMVAFQIVGSPVAADYRNFEPAREKLFDLVRRARPADRRLDAVREWWDSEAREARRRAEETERFLAIMPGALRPLWTEADPYREHQERDVSRLRDALATAIPDVGTRIRALFRGYGSSGGPWSRWSRQVDLAERLLLTYDTKDLVQAVDGRTLHPAELEGATRLFALTSERIKPGLRNGLTSTLRTRLLQHALSSGDDDKRARARSAFEQPAGR